MNFYEIDLLIFKFIHSDISNNLFDVLFPILRNKLTWIPLYLYWIYVLYKKFDKKIIYILLFAIILIVLCDNSCARIFKPLVERARPCQVLSLFDWFRDLGMCSGTYSFPSCHATNHTAIGVFMAYFLDRTWNKYLLIWVISICVSQIYVGVHYPSDIIGGIILGLIIGFAVKFLYQVFEKKRDF